MENVEKTEFKNLMSEEIIYLIIKRLTNTLGEAEAETLGLWLNENAENKRIFDEVFDIWTASSKSSSEFDAFEALKKVKQRLQSTNQADQIKKKRRLTFIRLAASVILIVGIGALSYYVGLSRQSKSAKSITEINAPMGSRTKVTLPDGTKVWLNGGSSLRFGNLFNKADRSVVLKGEGYFDVTHKKSLPFIVNTLEIRIKVLGTAFNIKAYPEEGSVETTLERGSLAIEKMISNGGFESQTVLEPNQRATYIRKEGKVHLADIDQKLPEAQEMNSSNEIVHEKFLISKKVDTRDFTSWKDNKLVFRNESFESLTLKLERWYGVKIEVTDEEIKNYHFNGTFEKETIQDVLKIIHITLPIKYTVNHDLVVISLDK